MTTAPEPPGAHTDQGRREHQQDAYCYSQFDVPTRTLIAVADGLGSDVIADAAVNLAIRIADEVDPDSPGFIIDLTRAVLPEMARYAADDSRAASHLRTFGDSTMSRPADTALIVATVTDFGEVHVAWLGDCRAYLLTVGGQLIQLTDDHNRAASGRPDIISRTRGRPTGHTPQSSWHSITDLDRAKRLLVCTDGVHGALAPGGDGRAFGQTVIPGGPDERRHEAIRQILQTVPDPGQAAIQLVNDAVHASGADADNATAVVLDIPEETL
ncbi:MULTISPECIES: PP2C family protein-serine/threonine phosphatase [Nocardia]|uniref:Protein phosphatase 2C n=1 Tax=Nocardia africana TaxID=134964 RepID=A0A378X837_9NOCA|nr:protein phosphatase 2C domain-containing protein [Nocardia africana]MCC3317948.1 protein phosphatase 2C domain-containing protein [Nocardia africana]SUA48723.1 Protein phosphatase 2C [Nocardia africana]